MTTSTDYLDTLHRDHRLLLDIVLADRDASVDAWHHWSTGADIDRPDYSTFQMLPQVSHRLSELGLGHPWLGRLRGIHKNRWFLNHLLLRAVFPVVDALNSKGIEVLLIKGVAMTPFYGNDLGLRPMQDVDLVVDKSRLGECFRILQELGWHSSPGFSTEMLRKKVAGDDKAIGFSRENAAIDLHWRIADLDFSDSSGIRSRAATLVLAGRDFVVPAPTEQLYLACVHGLKWELYPKLLWVCDGVRLLRSAGDEIDWPLLAAICKRNRLQQVVMRALGVLFRYTSAPRGFDLTVFEQPRPAFLYRRELETRLISPSRRSPLNRAIASLAIELRKERGPQWFRVAGLLRRPLSKRRMRGTAVRALRALVAPRWSLRRRCGSLAENVIAPVADLPVLVPGAKVEFGTGSVAIDMLVDSWSSSESGWTWSFGRESTLAFRVAPGWRSDLLLSFRIEAMLTDAHSTQRVDVLVNGRPVERWSFAEAPGTRLTRALVVSTADCEGSVYLTFQVAQPRNPARLGLSTDDRELGVRIWSMTAVPVAQLGGCEGTVQAGSTSQLLLGAGWAAPGRNGVWAIGAESEIVVPSALLDEDRMIRFESLPLLPRGADYRDVDVVIDGRRVAVWRLARGGGGCLSLAVPEPLTGKRFHTVVFRSASPFMRDGGSSPGAGSARTMRLVRMQLPG